MNEVNFALIGCGHVGQAVWLPLLRFADGGRLVGIYDVRTNLRRALAESYHVKSYKSLDDTLKDEDVEAVVIATPHDLH